MNASHRNPPSPWSPDDGLLALVYAQLRQIAQHRMRGQPANHTLQATALVHEAYARLMARGARFDGAAPFFFAASRAMRDILVEHARARARSKRRGGERTARQPLNVADLAAIDQGGDQILALDAALERLQQEEPDLAALVRLRFLPEGPDE